MDHWLDQTTHWPCQDQKSPHITRPRQRIRESYKPMYKKGPRISLEGGSKGNNSGDAKGLLNWRS